MSAVHLYDHFDQEHSTGRNQPPRRREDVPALSPEINRLLSAAATSEKFRRLLLSDPLAAIGAKYNGESFRLEAEELAQIATIEASTLAEFAGELLDRLQLGRGSENNRFVRKNSAHRHSEDSAPASVPEPTLHTTRTDVQGSGRS